MENITIAVFDEATHANPIYELSKKYDFYPDDIYSNVFNFKKICPTMLNFINQKLKTKKERNSAIRHMMKNINELSGKDTVCGYVALNANKCIVGFLLYVAVIENPMGQELTFIFVDEKYRNVGIGKSLMGHYLKTIIERPIIVKVKAGKSQTFYKQMGFKTADETIEKVGILKDVIQREDIIEEISFIQDILPHQKQEYQYMYYTTDKYEEVCLWIDILEKNPDLQKNFEKKVSLLENSIPK